MKRELYQHVYQLLDTAAEVDLRLPTDLDQIGLVNITSQANQFSLRFHFLGDGSRTVTSPIDGEIVDPGEIGAASDAAITVLRVLLPLKMYSLLLFEDFDFDYVSLSLPSDLQVGSAMSAGDSIGTVSDDHLEIIFVALPAGGSGDPVSQDPAIILRLFALFSANYYHLVRNAVSADSSTQFGHARLLAAYDGATSAARRLLRDVLLQESQILGSLDLPASAGVENRLSPLPVTNTTRTVFLSDLEGLIAASPDRFVLRYLFDMHLYIAVFQADQYEVDLIELGSAESFSSLASSSLAFKAIINGPYYSLFECPKLNWFSRGMNYLLAYTFSEKGLTKGHLKFRGVAAQEDADCPGATDRYYFIQNSDRSFAFANGVVPDVPEVQVGVDNLSGVIHSGAALDTESDFAHFSNKSPSQGMPFFGWLTRSGVDYFVIAMRRDEFSATFEPVHRALTASFQEIVDYLLQLGAQDVIWTDGDDSVGMIIDNQVLIEPGWKKDSSMPLAIGLRRV